MIPKIIHYCWFGRGEMPEVALGCIESWHRFMPDWEYRLWNEDNFDVDSVAYTKEAYAAKKYAFVSDYVRLLVLEKEGGIYLDTDVEVYKSFDDLLCLHAFAGFEGSKHLPVGTCVMASEAHGEWISEQLKAYDSRRFIMPDGSLDLTTNVQFITSIMAQNSFVQNGREQDYKDLHVFPVEYFCPRQTTGEFIKTDNTYSNHLGIGSWSEGKSKFAWLGFIGQKNMTRLIKLKRRILG
jgi:Mannosyltransferase OCH1 and related enzymes